MVHICSSLSLSLCKPSDLLNPTFTPLKHFNTSHKDHLQFVKDKEELIARVLLDYKTQLVQDRVLNA